MLGSQQLSFIKSISPVQQRQTWDVRVPEQTLQNVCAVSDAWSLSPPAGDLCSEQHVNEGWTPPRRHSGVWLKLHDGKSLWSRDADASVGFGTCRGSTQAGGFWPQRLSFGSESRLIPGPERVPTAPVVQGGRITWPRRCWPRAPWPSCAARRCWTCVSQTRAWPRRRGGRWPPEPGASLRWRSCWGRRGWTGSAGWGSPCSRGRRGRRPSEGGACTRWRRGASRGAACRRRPRAPQEGHSATGCWESAGVRGKGIQSPEIHLVRSTEPVNLIWDQENIQPLTG